MDGRLSRTSVLSLGEYRRLSDMRVLVAWACVLLAGCLGGHAHDQDADGDVQEVDAGEEGCEQEVPWVTLGPPTDICTSLPEEHCANTGCPACHVCFVDFSCGPPPWDDPRYCWCWGDGKCYRLCEVDGDCGAEETCIEAEWLCGYDSPHYWVHLCWPDDYLPFPPL